MNIWNYKSRLPKNLNVQRIECVYLYAADDKIFEMCTAEGKIVGCIVYNWISHLCVYCVKYLYVLRRWTNINGEMKSFMYLCKMEVDNFTILGCYTSLMQDEENLIMHSTATRGSFKHVATCLYFTGISGWISE